MYTELKYSGMLTVWRKVEADKNVKAKTNSNKNPVI